MDSKDMSWNNGGMSEKGQPPYEEGQVLGYTPTNDATHDAVFGDVSHGPNYRAV